MSHQTVTAEFPTARSRFRAAIVDAVVTAWAVLAVVIAGTVVVPLAVQTIKAIHMNVGR